MVKCLNKNCANNENEKCSKNSILIGFTCGCMDFESIRDKNSLSDQSYPSGTRYGIVSRKNLNS